MNRHGVIHLLLWLVAAFATTPLTGQDRSFDQAQDRPSIHMLELEAHRDVIVDFAGVDSLAAALPPPLPRALAPTKEIVGYLPYWKYNSESYNYTMLNYDLLTQINYFSVELDSNGNIMEDNGWPRPQLVDFANSQGVKVKLCATLFGSAAVAGLLSSAANRQRAIGNLLAAVQAGGADGVDIDFEPLPAGQKDNLITFMQTLTDTFKANLPGSIVTVAVPAVDWSDRWDFGSLAQIVDGLFIMAYDYHWSGSETAGPISPLEGFSRDVTWTINDYLSETDHNAAKLILGLPYYGYDWPVTGSTIYAPTTGKGTARIYEAAYDLALIHGHQWDSNSSTPWFNYQDDGFRQVWYEDSLSLSLKYELARDQDLAGVGMWALGYDGQRTELWSALAGYLNVISPPFDLVAELTDGIVLLQWTHDNEEALTGYRVYRYTLPRPEAASLVAVVPVGITIYSDTGAVYGVTSYYWVSAVDTLGSESKLSASASIRPRDRSKPYILYQNYPNPFRELTLIQFDLSIAGDVQLKVYNLQGTLVQTLASGYHSVNSYSYPFQPLDHAGQQLASGIYIVTLRVDDNDPVSRKMILLR